MLRPLALCMVLVALGGCATSSMDTYPRQDLGRVIETTPGTVVSSRSVEISGYSSGFGTVAGGATGAVIGAKSFSGSGSSVAGVLLGIAGAVVGTIAEEMLTGSEGREYTIQTDDGRIITVVQREEDERSPISDGTPVNVQWGVEYSRVIPRTMIASPPPPTYGGAVGSAPGSPPPGSPPAGSPAAGSPPPGAFPGGTAPAPSPWIDPDARQNASAPASTEGSGASSPAATSSGTSGSSAAGSASANSLNRQQLRRYSGTPGVSSSPPASPSAPAGAATYPSSSGGGVPYGSSGSGAPTRY